MTAAVRDALPEDLPWIVSSEERLFGREAWSATFVAKDFAAGNSRYRIAHDGAAPVGYAVYGFEGDAFHLHNLAVLPEFRGCGWGRTLVDDCFRAARTRECHEVWLEVAVSNASAIALYRRFGFSDVRVRTKYYQPSGEDALVMRARLDDR